VICFGFGVWRTPGLYLSKEPSLSKCGGLLKSWWISIGRFCFIHMEDVLYLNHSCVSWGLLFALHIKGVTMMDLESRVFQGSGQLHSSCSLPLNLVSHETSYDCRVKKYHSRIDEPSSPEKCSVSSLLTRIAMYQSSHTSLSFKLGDIIYLKVIKGLDVIYSEYVIGNNCKSTN